MNADATDEQLGTELRKWTGATPALHPVGELLDRHWAAGFAYARLCTADARSAGMLTTAAFTRLFGEALRQDGPTSAWRPHLLVTVGRIASEWDGDHRREQLHPGLRSAPGEHGAAAARFTPAPELRMLAEAFRRLPQSARCLLWHTEVEAEPLSTPAALLGLHQDTAVVELRRARERLREECLRAHRELAPDQVCRRYARMLDVTYRRGGAELDPDLGAHLAGCPHCRITAEQLHLFNTGLGGALADAVLGWAGSAYAEVRMAPPEEPAPPAPDAGAALRGESFTAGLPGGAPGDGRSPEEQTADGAFAREAFEGWGRTRGRGSSAAAFTGGEDFAGPSGTPPASAQPPVPPMPPAPPGVPGAFGTPEDTSAGTPTSTPDGAPGQETAAPTAGHRARSSGGRSGRARSAAVSRMARSSRIARRAARRAAARRRNLAAAVATVSGLVVLPLALWTARSDARDTTAPAGAAGAAETPGPTAGGADPDSSRADTRQDDHDAQGPMQGRLRNVGSGLCVGVEGDAETGAEARMDDCSAAPGQRWTYETDGTLRSGADPGLCLDSGAGHSLRLAACADDAEHARSIRYDFTLRGNLVPRWNPDVALAPAATDGTGAVVLKARADDQVQRWAFDGGTSGDERLETVTYDTRTPAPAPAADDARTPRAAAAPTRP